MYTQIIIKNFYFFFFFCHIRMEPTTQNNGINAIKEVRKLFNERRSNLSRKEIKLEKNFVERKQSTTF